MMTFHWYFLFLAALIPIAIGAIWYNPKVFGTAWMNASGMTEEKAKGANMALVFGLTYFFSLLVAASLMAMTIHQTHIFSLFANDPTAMDPTSEAGMMLKGFMDKFGSNFRTFKHGAFHGALVGIFFAMPIMVINSLFERKGFKYNAINAGYWIVSLSIMGGFVCAFV
jgi:hypothetical protein